jgi:hypothetical protein
VLTAGTGAEGGSRSEKTKDDTAGPAVELGGLDHRALVHRPGVSEWKIADYVVGDKQAAVIPGTMMLTTRGMVLTMTTTRTVETT